MISFEMTDDPTDSLRLYAHGVDNRFIGGTGPPIMIILCDLSVRQL